MANWISVEESLPEDYVPVLVCAKHILWQRNVVLVDHIISYTDGHKTWADTDKTWKYFVTHWMPIPEPPNEGGTDE